MNHLVHCSKCNSFPCNCWQNQWGPDPAEAYREGYRRGFEAAKAAALDAIVDTDTVGCNHSYYAQLGDASATKSKILEAVRKIEPEVTR